MYRLFSLLIDHRSSWKRVSFRTSSIIQQQQRKHSSVRVGFFRVLRFQKTFRSVYRLLQHASRCERLAVRMVSWHAVRDGFPPVTQRSCDRLRVHCDPDPDYAGKCWTFWSESVQFCLKHFISDIIVPQHQENSTWIQINK